MLLNQLGVVLHGPGDKVFRALALRLRSNPQFKVLNAVVVSTAVDVVNVFKWLQRAPVVKLPDNSMLGHPLAFEIAVDVAVVPNG